MTWSVGGRARAFAAAVTVVCVAGQVHATGPTEQVLPWRNAVNAGKWDRLNSVVQIDAGGGLGTGTVIDTHFDGTNHWLCVVTADHVVRGANNIQVKFGDNGAEGVFGGATGAVGSNADSWYIQRPFEDLAVVAIKINANPTGQAAGLTRAQFAGRLNTPSIISGVSQASDLVNDTFTEVGYGGRGTWDVFNNNGNNPKTPAIRTATDSVADPNNVNNRIYFPSIDSNKRFQNNKIERTLHVLQREDPNNANSAIRYEYDSVMFDLNIPSANANDLLAGEGISYAGDSGGPYLFNGLNSQNVAAMVRPDGTSADGSARVNPDWAAGNMTLLDNVLMAVHTGGNSIPGGAGTSAAIGTTFFNLVDSSFGIGIPMTGARSAWIEGWCAYVPSPGTMGLFAAFGLAASRRRR